MEVIDIDDNGIFKALVGEDYLTVEKKNKDPFSFQSNARLLFSCNSIPKNYGDRSDGFYRRLIIIRFNHAVPPEKKDPNLLDKFRVEADGIFLFALLNIFLFLCYLYLPIFFLLQLILHYPSYLIFPPDYL